MTIQNDKTLKSSPVTDSGQPKSMSRRAVLRGGVTAMPAILTLQSGAALARTSNLISAAPSGTKIGDLTACLDTNSVYPVGESGNIYDLGEPPRAEVTFITERNYLTAQGSGDPISEGAMCERGGTYWYNPKDGTGWHTVELPSKGIVVSSGAMTSISDHVIDTTI